MTTQTTERLGLAVAALAARLGRRLRPVIADRPTVLAEIRWTVVSAYFLDELAAGWRSVVVYTGYVNEQISRVFGSNYGPLGIHYLQEQESLGRPRL